MSDFSDIVKVIETTNHVEANKLLESGEWRLLALVDLTLQNVAGISATYILGQIRKEET